MWVQLLFILILCFDGWIGLTTTSRHNSQHLLFRSWYSLGYWLWVCRMTMQYFHKVLKLCYNSNTLVPATHTLDAKTWEEANLHLENLYSTQAPLEVSAIFCKTWIFMLCISLIVIFAVICLQDFLAWRDLRVIDEILWYGWVILHSACQILILIWCMESHIPCTSSYNSLVQMVHWLLCKSQSSEI
jgi:hypothetical protein